MILRPLRGKVRCGYCKRILCRSHTKRVYYNCIHARVDMDEEHLFEKLFEDNIEKMVLDAIQIKFKKKRKISLDLNKKKEKKFFLEINKFKTDIIK
jgi:hypothetical protein